MQIHLTVVVLPDEFYSKSRTQMGTRYKVAQFGRLVRFNDAETINDVVGGEATITITYRQPTQDEYTRALNELNRLLVDDKAVHNNVIP